MFSSSNTRNPYMGPIGPVTYGLGRKPDLPPCSCFECVQQYRQEAEQHTWIHIYNDGVSNTQAESICKTLLANINSDLAFLKDQMARRGVGISQRWRKKTSKNRAAVLKTVDPDMYERKWHEGHIGYESRYDNWLIEARKHQDIHLLPYMSVENLKENPSRLIKLLRLRTEFSPADLATADNQRLTFGWTTGILETTFNGSAIVMHGLQYGKLVPWIREEIHRGDTMGFPRGQLILKAQSRLLSILRGVVEILVRDLPEDTKSAIPSTSNAVAMTSAGINSVHVDEPFSNCLAFDLRRLADISNSRQRAATDHLSLLQTDPAYMRRYIKLTQASGYANKLPEKVSFVMAAQDLDFEAWTVRHWTWISEEIAEFENVQSRFTDHIHRGQTLPPKFGKKLASFETLILHLLDMQSRHLQCVLPYRPGFQEYYNFTHHMKDGVAYTSHSSIHRRDDLREQAIANAESFVLEPLHWVIVSLTTNPDAPGVWDKFRLLEFLDQYLCKASAEERNRIDEIVLRKISDLAAFIELLAIVRSHRPRAEQIDLKAHRESSVSDLGLAWRLMSKVMANTELNSDGEPFTTERSLQEIPLDYSSIGPLLKVFIDQESQGEKSDSRWMIREVADRRALRVIWNKLRQEDQNRLKKAGIGSIDLANDLKLVSHDSDPEFLATLEAKRNTFLGSNPSARSVHKTRKPVYPPTGEKYARRDSHTQGMVKPVQPNTPKQVQPRMNEKIIMNAEPQTEWGNTPAGPKPTVTTKIKPKTRGELSVDQALEGLNILSSDNESQASETEKIAVKKSAYEVFRSLYAGEMSPTSIAWDKFVDAMAKASFMSRRCGGSAVSFEPTNESKWFGRGSIVFHRPHPNATIEPVMLKVIGKRMNKWFGWDNETFHLEK